MKERHPVTVKIDFSNHKTMVAYWADEMLWAVRQAITNPHFATIEDLNLNHVVRCARAAYYHAGKCNAALKPLDGERGRQLIAVARS